MYRAIRLLRSWITFSEPSRILKIIISSNELAAHTMFSVPGGGCTEAALHNLTNRIANAHKSYTLRF